MGVKSGCKRYVKTLVVKYNKIKEYTVTLVYKINVVKWWWRGPLGHGGRASCEHCRIYHGYRVVRIVVDKVVCKSPYAGSVCTEFGDV